MSGQHATPSSEEIARNPLGDMPSPTQETKSLRESWLGRLHTQRVVQSDNDFLVAVAPASKSAVSGVGKTTLGIRLAREFNVSGEEWQAKKAATLEAGALVDDILRNEEDVPNRYSVLADEMQGTLSSDGADSRRGMANSVIKLSRALATLRYRQLSIVFVTQSTDWIDQRVRKLLDALILIQRPGFAKVFNVYENDLSTRRKEYTELRQTLEWDPLPGDDEDYQYLHMLKRQSAFSQPTEEDEDQELPKDAQMQIAQSHRDAGRTLQWIADNVDGITYSRETIRKNTVARDDA